MHYRTTKAARLKEGLSPSVFKPKLFCFTEKEDRWGWWCWQKTYQCCNRPHHSVRNFPTRLNRFFFPRVSGTMQAKTLNLDIFHEIIKMYRSQPQLLHNETSNTNRGWHILWRKNGQARERSLQYITAKYGAEGRRAWKHNIWTGYLQSL